MSVPVQESLLDVCDEPFLGALAGSVRRTPLAHGAWVDLRPGWLAGSGVVFSRLAEAVPWRAEKRHMYDKVVAVPRLLCFYGEDAPLPDPVLTGAREALNAHYGPGARRAVPHGGTVPVPGRAGQRRVARRHDRARQVRGHHGRHRVARHAAGPAAAPAKRPAGRAWRGAAVRGRARRPAGHGRQLPAHMG